MGTKVRFYSAMAGATLCFIVFSGVVGYMIGNVLHQAHKSTSVAQLAHRQAKQAKHEAVVVRRLAQEIQHQRFASCVSQNHRHDNSLDFIIRLAERQSKHADAHARREIAKQVQQYRVLFQALAPKQNCRKLTKG